MAFWCPAAALPAFPFTHALCAAGAAAEGGATSRAQFSELRFLRNGYAAVPGFVFPELLDKKMQSS